MNKIKILIISESIDIEDSSGSKANVGLIRNLKEIGYNVTVLHFTRKPIQLDNIKCIEISERKRFYYLLSRIQRLINRYLKIKSSNFFENIFGFSFTFFNDTKSIAAAITKYYKQEELIITLSKGASFRPHYAMLSLPNFHNKWLAYIHDPYPFHYYPRPYNWVEPGYRIKEIFFRKVSEKAKYSGFPSLLLQEWMGSYFPNFLKTGIIIPHQNLEKDLRKELPLPNYISKTKFSLLHAGNLMKQRSPKGLIEGYRLFLDKNIDANENSQLLFLGNAYYHREYLEKELDKNIYWSQGNVPFKEVDVVQKTVSVNIILESKSEISPFLPGKFPHCVSANKPILLLGPYYSESKRLLGNSYPYMCEADNVYEIAKQIEVLYQNWKENINQALDRIDLDDYFGLSYLKKQIESIYNEN